MDVLLENFAAPSPRLASRALGVADRWLRGPRPDERLVDGVLKISQRSDFADGKARYALLEAVRQSNPSLLTGKFRQVLLSSLNANEPDVLISAIQILDDDQAPVRRSSQISGALTPLLKRYEPALRGVVLRAIARTAPPRDPVVEDALIASLTDKSAYVRSQACMGLGVVGTDKSVPALIPLLADLEDNRQQYYASTFEHPTVLKALNSSYWPHVADAAQYALLRLAPTAPRVDPPKPKDVEGSLKSNAKALRAWYAKNKDAYKAAAGGASASTTTQNASAKSSGEHSTQPVKAPLPANGN
jgi:hypothetical protein